jgi:hypothetical protein
MDVSGYGYPQLVDQVQQPLSVDDKAAPKGQLASLAN